MFTKIPKMNNNDDAIVIMIFLSMIHLKFLTFTFLIICIYYLHYGQLTHGIDRFVNITVLPESTFSSLLISSKKFIIYFLGGRSSAKVGSSKPPVLFVLKYPERPVELSSAFIKSQCTLLLGKNPLVSKKILKPSMGPQLGVTVALSSPYTGTCKVIKRILLTKIISQKNRFNDPKLLFVVFK